MELHADMLMNPMIPRNEMEKERKVVLEEINKDSNSPQKKMYESIDLSGIPCQTDEMDELRKILSTGFYA